MTGSNFFPYRTATDLPLNIEVEGIERGPDGSLHAFTAEGDFTVALETSLQGSVLSTLVPGSETDDPPVEVSVRLTSIESRYRDLIPMAKVGDIYEAELQLSTTDFAGTLQISAVAARSTYAHSPEPGLAVDRGSLLAWSDVFKIQFSEPALPPGKFLDTAWRDFSKDDDVWLKAHASSLFAVDPGTELPILLLNSSFHPDIRTILDSRGTTGRTARVRDAAFSFIGQGAWTSILSVVLGDVRRAVEECEEDEAEALSNMPMEWKRFVFVDWAPYLFTEVTHPAEDRDFVAALASTDHEELVSKRLPTAVQTRFSGASKFGALIEEILT